MSNYANSMSKFQNIAKKLLELSYNAKIENKILYPNMLSNMKKTFVFNTFFSKNKIFEKKL